MKIGLRFLETGSNKTPTQAQTKPMDTEEIGTQGGEIFDNVEHTKVSV
ncbi:MAG: hypothetical protein SFY66_07475 [Oculatellaceae cyanobacterium bins.114]|nr:hypothetical protein [Oculatellaceae cyanobacterium bins.114]